MNHDIGFINGLRAIAAFWVLAAHCMIWGGWYGIPLPSPKLAVDMFMMISGYLMTANALARADSEPLSKPKFQFAFWVRRYFRLAPVYYLQLAVVIIISDQFLSGYQVLRDLDVSRWNGDIYNPARINYDLKNIAMHVSFIFGLFPDYSFSTFLPDWSLSLEMQFYAAFPFIFLLASRYPVLTSISLPLVFLVVVKLAGLNGLYPEPSILLLKIQYFLIGIAVVFLGRPCSIVVRLSLILSIVMLPLIEYRLDRAYFVAVFIALALLLLHVGRGSQILDYFRTILSSPLMRWSSDMSYSVYLFHGLFVSSFGLLLNEYPSLLTLKSSDRVGLMFAFVLVGSCVTASFVHRFVETPGIDMGRKVVNKYLRR